MRMLKRWRARIWCSHCPLHCRVYPGGRRKSLLEEFLRIRDKAAQIAAADVEKHDGAQLPVLAGDHRRTRRQRDACQRAERHDSAGRDAGASETVVGGRGGVSRRARTAPPHGPRIPAMPPPDEPAPGDDAPRIAAGAAPGRTLTGTGRSRIASTLSRDPRRSAAAWGSAGGRGARCRDSPRRWRSRSPPARRRRSPRSAPQPRGRWRCRGTGPAACAPRRGPRRRARRAAGAPPDGERSSVSRFVPKIFTPRSVRTPVESMLMRLMMGCVQPLRTPGMWSFASSSEMMSFLRDAGPPLRRAA